MITKKEAIEWHEIYLQERKYYSYEPDGPRCLNDIFIRVGNRLGFIEKTPVEKVKELLSDFSDFKRSEIPGGVIKKLKEVISEIERRNSK